jgi:hypothetical protein
MRIEASPEHQKQSTRRFTNQMGAAVGIAPEVASKVRYVGDAELPSVFPVSDLACAAIATAAAAAAELIATRAGEIPAVVVDRTLASLWFTTSIRPSGWTLPSPWDPIAGDYQSADGWIRLHTNAPHHRAAALAVLGAAADRQAVSSAVARWQSDTLEGAIVERHGCAATMRSIEAWAAHPQGAHVSREPLVATRFAAEGDHFHNAWSAKAPLQGIRVLDLTRVLAGPVATRFLAGLGADVLRIDPPDWEEPALEPDVTLGKRCARLDLRVPSDRIVFETLLQHADVLVHGYRPDALEKLGFDARARQRLRPGLVDVSLDAYGFTGPWRTRRGFDSLVQMSAGIAEAGMRRLNKHRPTPLPVQALDHATGYLMAAAAIRGLTLRNTSGHGFEAKASLARTAHLLISAPMIGAPTTEPSASPPKPDESDWQPHIESTDFGPAQRLSSPVVIADQPLRWDRPAARLGSARPAW